VARLDRVSRHVAAGDVTTRVAIVSAFSASASSTSSWPGKTKSIAKRSITALSSARQPGSVTDGTVAQRR
jgi:hypothetical protein